MKRSVPFLGLTFQGNRNDSYNPFVSQWEKCVKSTLWKTIRATLTSGESSSSILILFEFLIKHVQTLFSYSYTSTSLTRQLIHAHESRDGDRTWKTGFQKN